MADFFHHLSIKTKLKYLLSFIMLLLVASMIFTYIVFADVKTTYNELHEDSKNSTLALKEVKKKINEINQLSNIISKTNVQETRMTLKNNLAKLHQQLDSIESNTNKQLEDSRLQMHNKIDFSRMLIAGAILLSAIFILLFTKLFTTTILNALTNFTEYISKLSQGTFTEAQTKIHDKTEFGVIGEGLDALSRQLTEYFTQSNMIISKALEGDFQKNFVTENFSGDFLNSLDLED